VAVHAALHESLAHGDLNFLVIVSIRSMNQAFTRHPLIFFQREQTVSEVNAFPETGLLHLFVEQRAIRMCGCNTHYPDVFVAGIEWGNHRTTIPSPRAPRTMSMTYLSSQTTALPKI
jgi:hypothetical protein